MKRTFQDRRHAGHILASWLRPFAGRLDVLVLGLPRGGVPVAAEVAHQLHLPLDVLCVRKVGVPAHEELAMGAVAPGGVVVRNELVIARSAITQEEFDLVARREREELERRESRYRANRPPLDLRDKVAVLVDDGIATGATIRAAIRAARELGSPYVVVATPVIARDSLEQLRHETDDIVTVLAPETLFAIGEFYEDFRPTDDEQVEHDLEAAAAETMPHPAAGTR